MNDDMDRQSKLLDTTDCLEAVSILKSWKNFLFLITTLCLVLLQVSFWLVNTGYVKADDTKKLLAAVSTPPEEITSPKADTPTTTKTDAPAESPVPAADANQPVKKPVEIPVEKPAEKKKLSFPPEIKIKYLTRLTRFFNFVLIPTTLLYCLTMLFGLKISMLGRLGGINHITRAFFLSLTFLVLLLPWQGFFAGVVVGAMYTPKELLSACTDRTEGIFSATFFYLRFVGYWLLVMLILICAQLRSFRWAKTILRRLEII